MGVAPVSLAQGADIPQITVFHSGAETPELVSFDTKIEPGDVIEVKRTADAAPPTAWMAPDIDLQPLSTLALQ